MSPKKRKTKISTGIKKNLTTIINELSIIIGRKGWPKENPRKALTNAFKNTDAHIAAIALVLPEVDKRWRESGAQQAFLSIKKKRQWIIRLLFAAAILGSLVTVGLIIFAVIALDYWIKWVILAAGVMILMLAASSVPPYVISPYISKRDAAIPKIYKNECVVIDAFIKELLEIRKSV
jgi:hypothetical protein